MEFDHTGEFLATGDQGGRVVLFERVIDRPSTAEQLHPDQRGPSQSQNHYEYRYLTEFQSHEPEFDYLKSLEIEEKVNKIRWIRRWDRNEDGGNRHCHSLLTTNDKTIKLWKVFERRVTSLADFNLCNGSSNYNRTSYSSGLEKGSPLKTSSAGPNGVNHQLPLLRVPRVVSSETILTSKCRRTFASAHTYHINSISLSSDQETFLSADDLRVNLWHLDRPDTSFVMVDIKPTNMEDLAEVITVAEFHPCASHMFAHASSKGVLRLADMRCGALCDNHVKMFEDASGPSSSNFYSDIIASINDLKFVGQEGTFVATRDYMNLRLWDLRKESGPLMTHPIQEGLRSRLSDLYESDFIFDRFDVAVSGDGQRFATGTYSNFFRVVNLNQADSRGDIDRKMEPMMNCYGEERLNANDVLLESSRDPTRRRLAVSGGRLGGRFVGFGRSTGRSKGNVMPTIGNANMFLPEESLGSDLSIKIQHLSWHPSANIIATASCNSLYIFGADATNNWQ